MEYRRLGKVRAGVGPQLDARSDGDERGRALINESARDRVYRIHLKSPHTPVDQLDVDLIL